MPVNSRKNLQEIRELIYNYLRDWKGFEKFDVIEKDLEKFEHISNTLDEYGLEDYLLDEPKDDKEFGPCIDEFYSLLRYPMERVTLDEEKFIDIIKTHFDLATLYNKCENLTEEEFEICKKIYNHKNIDEDY